MSRWQQVMVYCRSCQDWRDALPHQECEQASDRSALLLDYDGSLLMCSACQQIWLIEATTAICPTCHQPQQVAFTEDTLHLQENDQVLAIDGPLIYVLTQAGALIVAGRTSLAHSDAYTQLYLQAWLQSHEA